MRVTQHGKSFVKKDWEKEKCPECKHDNLESKMGCYHNKVRLRFECNKCECCWEYWEFVME